MSRSRTRAAGLIALIAVLAAGAAVGGYAETRAVRAAGGTDRTSAAAPPAAYAGTGATPHAAAGRSPGPAPLPRAVARALAPALHAPGLGSRLRARVLDVDSGTVVYDAGGSVPAAPASTAKLLTAAAVLTVHAPTDRITTTVHAGRSGALVLVGAGDPTLTGAADDHPGAYPHAARIADLAAQLARAHLRPTRIVVDDSAFSGPAISPAWAPEDVPSDYGSAITAVLADGGRATPAAGTRSAAPDLAAGHELAAALGRPNLPVTRGRAAPGSRVVARVRSATYATLVAQMLQNSDNVIAECLARQVALAEHRPPSFTGAAAAIRTVLTRLGVDPGAGMVDGSGLAARDRLSPATLAALMRVVAGTGHPQLHAVIEGLPVAGWSGTLADRYVRGSSTAAAGLVRAKTGTLSGVSTLAGIVHDRSGRLLAFALIADRTGATAAAEAALDAIAARLAGCGCS